MDLNFITENVSRNPGGMVYCVLLLKTPYGRTELVNPISCFCNKIGSEPRNIVQLGIYLEIRVNTVFSHGKKPSRD